MKKCTFIFFSLQLILIANKSNAQIKNAIDSAINYTIHKSISQSEFIATCFFIADNYMDLEQYDSAQIWLNKIHNKLPVKSNSISNYFLTTRQAEVYYYNNLQQLGLQESKRGLEMAILLNDSLLIADSYNFLGLFNMNIDSVKKSIQYFKEGIKYTNQPPYPSKYLSLSMPHHLYGNLAEALYKLKQYDSALYNIKISLQKAQNIKFERGIAIAYNSMGDIFLAQNKLDSAIEYFKKSKFVSEKSLDIDVALLCQGGLASSYDRKKLNKLVNTELSLGFNLLAANPTINKFFSLKFMEIAISIYTKNSDKDNLIKTLKLKSEIELANINGNDIQIQTILSSGLANEKRVLNLEVVDAQQKQKIANSRLIITLIAFGFLGIGFLVYRYYLNQKLELSKIRHKISQDLHDDIGASLSSLQIYGVVAEKTLDTNPKKTQEMLQKISTQSKLVMDNMNDIVWSMNTNETNTISLEAKVKNYSVELLSENGISFECTIDNNIEPLLKSITAKRNILLIIREAMNNLAKYSKATNASLKICLYNKVIDIIITDNGIGFDLEKRKHGNGLENMRKRTIELDGSIDFRTAHNEGTTLQIKIPIKSV